MKLIASTAALAVLSTAAIAADLPSRKSTPVFVQVEQPGWGGAYAGVNFGVGLGGSNSVQTGSWGSNGSAIGWNGLDGIDLGRNHLLTASAGIGGLGLANSGSTTIDRFGFLGGGTLGYNWQWGNIVAGVETDIDLANIRGSGSYAGSGLDAYFLGLRHVPGKDDGDNISPFNIANQSHLGGAEIRTGLDYIGTLRGRVGYLVTPTILLYGTGGMAYGGAWAQANYSSATASNLGGAEFLGQFAGANVFNQMGIGSARTSKTMVGWTAGAGMEWRILPNVTWGVSALYYDLGTLGLTGGTAAAPAINLAGLAATAGANGLVPIAGAIPGAGPLSTGSHSQIRMDGIMVKTGVNVRFFSGL